MKRKLVAVACVLSMFWVLSATDALGQATRTWVSGVGSDANPCSRTAPCQTWAGTIGKTADGGEMDNLDPGGFGQVTITKSILIDGASALASILATAGGSGIVIDAPGKKVVLRNLALNGVSGGSSPGGNAIRIVNAAQVTLEHVNIGNFGGDGITIESPGGTAVRVSLKDVDIRNVGGSAVNSQPAGIAILNIDDSHFDNNGNGIRAMDRTTGHVRDTVIFNSSGDAIRAQTTVAGTFATLFVDDVALVRNGTGIIAQGAVAEVTMSEAFIEGNGLGLNPTSGGGIVTAGDNVVRSNATNGAPNSSTTKV